MILFKDININRIFSELVKLLEMRDDIEFWD